MTWKGEETRVNEYTLKCGIGWIHGKPVKEDKYYKDMLGKDIN